MILTILNESAMNKITICRIKLDYKQICIIITHVHHYTTENMNKMTGKELNFDFLS
jgi:hypothetical protein